MKTSSIGLGLLESLRAFVFRSFGIWELKREREREGEGERERESVPAIVGLFGIDHC